ncbi:hypothetical protein KSP39_PZI011623 [Platanthera zijinensis]|uniref:Thylakoid soluble phosphoprotein TSP9 n=1 Tax=Platanthera zijinensis TaxID=2320716 RepID=A0AAP0BHU3_9ASPA
MASLSMAFVAPAAVSVRVYQASVPSKTSGASAEDQKGLLDWIIGGLQKPDQLVETDPVLKKVEEKTGGSGTTGRKSTTSISVSSNKKSNGGGGVFGGLFAKK